MSELQEWHRALCFKYNNTTSLEETNVRYVTIRSWWYSSRAVTKSAIHNHNNWLGFWHFHVKQWGGGGGGFMLHVKHLEFLCEFFVKLFNNFHDSNIWFFFLWKHLHKSSPEELVDMLICNLSEVIHNIYLQQYRKSVWYLFVAISNDYVRAFKQSASYKVYLNGGRCGKGLGRDELRLWQTSQSSDLLQMANVVVKYTSESSFSNRTPHLEGQEVFGSTKLKVNIAPRSKGWFTQAWLCEFISIEN
jgi:hypothetical protein